MTKQEALKIIGKLKPNDKIDTMKKISALSLALDCIQECIDKEESPCFDCVRESCKGCLF